MVSKRMATNLEIVRLSRLVPIFVIEGGKLQEAWAASAQMLAGG
jgi:hypothetical protein